MAPLDTTFYDLLEVSPEATPEELTQAYKKRALKLHPDKGGNAEQFKTMKAAYDVLKDLEKRQMYDTHGPAFVRFMDGDIEASMELLHALIKTASKIVLCTLPIFAGLVFFPAIVFSLRWDGRISWPWVIAFIPVLTLQLAFVMLLLKMRSMINKFAESSSDDDEDEEERAAKNQSKLALKQTLTLAIVIILLLMVQQVVFAVRLDGSISSSWFLVCIPYFVLELFYICGRVYTKILLRVVNPTAMLPPFLWLAVRGATLILIAGKADEKFDISWKQCTIPLLVGAGARFLWSIYQTAIASSRPTTEGLVEGESSEQRKSGHVGSTLCILASWLVIVLLAALKMDGSRYSAFVVFLPYFLLSGMGLCCCACLACCGPLLLQAVMQAEQEEAQNSQGNNGQTPLINPQSGARASYNSV